MEAYEAEGEERERLWALDCSVHPARRHDAVRAGWRRIPVVVVHPVRPWVLTCRMPLPVREGAHQGWVA